VSDEIQASDVISSRRAHDGWLVLRVDTIRYPSGREGTIDVVEHNGGVTLLAIDDEDRVLLVRQFRHATGKPLLELPAGTIDPGEAPEVCAERELQEETGYRPGKMELLGGFYSAPGYSTEYLYCYLCTDLVESSLQGDEEHIVVERVPLAEVVRRIASGEIEDAKTSGALLLYLARRGVSFG
jgi:ADP-ribose pyrophosphatase